MRRRSSFAATPRIAKTISAKSEVVSRNGSASERMPAPGLLHLASDDQKIGRVARQAVNGRDDHNVAIHKDGHQFSKLWPVSVGAGQLLPVHVFAPGSLQLGKLAGEVLRLGRDAGVAVNHAAILEQNCVTEKRNLFSAFGLFQISSTRCCEMRTGAGRGGSPK